MKRRFSGRVTAAALAAAFLAGCGSPASSVSPTAGVAGDARPASGPFPPACTVPKVKSGAMVTSVSAYGNLERRNFSLARPFSSWTQLQWLETPPPGKHRAAAPAVLPHGSGHYYIYFGTYTVSDGTTGCFYLVNSVDGKPIVENRNAAITAQPRIPPEGATLPQDFGTVKNIYLKLKIGDTGSGTMTLVHYDGSNALTGTIKITGRVESKKG
ncbi:MAG TPA: hypothetical protein VK760_14345 [Candidatus Acidoferrales bacterium]|jgi:hypothetical protein|nr:hypothetical protein [Candidatus Acidoferrales bacterium]